MGVETCFKKYFVFSFKSFRSPHSTYLASVMVCVEHCDFSIAMFLASVFSSEIFHNAIIRNFLQSCSVPSASETNYHLELEILLKLNEIPEIEGMMSGADC